MLTLITDKKYAVEWDKVANHPMQSWNWGAVRETVGIQILRVGRINEKGKLTEVFLATVHDLPLGKKLVNFSRSSMPPSDVLGFIASHVPHLVCIKLEPSLLIETAGQYRIPLLLHRWQKDGFTYTLSNSRVFAQHTFVMDLSYAEEAMLSRMKSKTRYNIKLAVKKGVVIKDDSDSSEGFEIFFKLYQETIKRQNYLGHNYEYHKEVWETLYKAGMARILTAYYNDIPLASYQLFFFKDRAYYVYGGTSILHKDVMASNLLMWESIRLAKKMKCEYFDMWGALSKDYNPHDPWAGFHRFKEGFGAVHQTYLPTMDVVFDNVYYSVFSFLWPVRTRVLETIHKFRG
jgi:hypothetical protein